MSLRIIRLKEVITLTGLSKSSIYRYADGKAFPQSVQLGARSVGWIEEEINQWMQGRIDERKVE
ncbi:transcriptional regulator [Vibrio harveyi]|uniref:helix-turn-helix transcriptional regulator n=1 Tax=Vibrio harveyi TaxID=669 RepID=UPI000D78884E|nr:AlpA family transcriptional regulator [Vibrio harveyi]GBL02058.1 transcriptional regulator [Vibrio harveyi]